MKVNSSKEHYKDSSCSEEDANNFNLMVRKFGKFLKKSKDRKFPKSSKKIENNNNFTCFECGKQGHIKFECLIYLRTHVVEKKEKTKQKAPTRHARKKIKIEPSSTNGRSHSLRTLVNNETNIQRCHTVYFIPKLKIGLELREIVLNEKKKKI